MCPGTHAQAAQNRAAWSLLPADVRALLTELATAPDVEVTVGHRFGLTDRGSPAVVHVRADAPATHGQRLAAAGFYRRKHGTGARYVYTCGARELCARIASLPLDVVPWLHRARATAGTTVRACDGGEAPCWLVAACDACPGRPHAAVRTTCPDLRDGLVAAGFVPAPGRFLEWPAIDYEEGVR